MIKKDYIQRYVDELAKMIAKMLQLKEANQPKMANNELDDFGNRFLGIDLNELIKLEPNTVINHLVSTENFELIHFKILEDLLFHKYLLNLENSNLKSITFKVLNYQLRSDKDFNMERNNRIKQLVL